MHCCDEDGYTPLHRAAYSGHVAVVSALIGAGSKVNPRTIDGWTPLHSACRWSRVTVASFLLQHGAELNAQTNGGLTPLHLAASNTTPFSTDSPHTLELLLSQRHLNPGLRSGSGETASEVARRTGPHHVLFEMVQDCVNVVPFSWMKNTGADVFTLFLPSCKYNIQQVHRSLFRRWVGGLIVFCWSIIINECIFGIIFSLHHWSWK